MPTTNSLILRNGSLLDTRAGAIVGKRDVVVEDGGELLGDVRALSVGLEDGGALHGTVDMDVTLPGDLVD